MSDKVDPRVCSGSSLLGGHAGEYGKIGFSPCRAYVAHESNKPCDVLENIQESFTQECNCTPPKSPCRSEPCPCGDFISHRVFDICPAVA